MEGPLDLFMGKGKDLPNSFWSWQWGKVQAMAKLFEKRSGSEQALFEKWLKKPFVAAIVDYNLFLLVNAMLFWHLFSIAQNSDFPPFCYGFTEESLTRAEGILPTGRKAKTCLHDFIETIDGSSPGTRNLLILSLDEKSSPFFKHRKQGRALDRAFDIGRFEKILCIQKHKQFSVLVCINARTAIKQSWLSYFDFWLFPLAHERSTHNCLFADFTFKACGNISLAFDFGELEFRPPCLLPEDWM